MDIAGSYWLGLNDIEEKESGLGWTDASLYDYENWLKIGNSKGKCAMITRHEGSDVPASSTFTG
jgi:hypothetical protein